MKFEDLDEETQQGIIEKAEYLIAECIETEDFEVVKLKVFEIVKESILKDK
jgi:hypothetical protein